MTAKGDGGAKEADIASVLDARGAHRFQSRLRPSGARHHGAAQGPTAPGVRVGVGIVRTAFSTAAGRGSGEPENRIFLPVAKDIFCGGAWDCYFEGQYRFEGAHSPSSESLRAGLPKVASNNRTTATPEENKAIVGGSLSHFGTLSVNAADKTFTFKIATATFPNWDGTEQKRPFTVTGDELKYTVAAASGGGTATVVWKRAK